VVWAEGILEAEAREKRPQKIQIQPQPFLGGLWFAAWLFTIGFLHLGFWKAVFAILIWPYFLGDHLSALMH
jgi:hypothetical protein